MRPGPHEVKVIAVWVNLNKKNNKIQCSENHIKPLLSMMSFRYLFIYIFRSPPHVTSQLNVIQEADRTLLIWRNTALFEMITYERPT